MNSSTLESYYQLVLVLWPGRLSRKLSPEAVRNSAQGHTLGWWQSLGQDPGILVCPLHCPCVLLLLGEKILRL